ncbi:RidA family protein [Paenibacillus nasutitermitis]|uniref:Reactive intermediate/imine deaminase n=1 Tax=Paenibacillus nasutitermitis TaxID=1652958 RepID=A0A916ZEY9_9BACL|nr:Rid family detoxifying hydrolase [Paenibacillus nasutitermitis]GGD93706.1 reactive intermediate/imine deaminase [Paenibacillus nasutitermitis]
MRRAVNTKDASIGSGPYSQGVAVGNMVFISGQGPLDAAGNIVSGTIEAETKLTMDNIQAIVEAGGYTMDDVVKVGVYLASLADFDRFNAVYQTYFNSPLPARTCVEAGLDGIKVEIDAIVCKTE